MKNKILLLVLVAFLLTATIGVASAVPEVTIVNPLDSSEFNYIPIDVDGTISSGPKITLVEAYVYDEGGLEVDYQELSFEKVRGTWNFWGSVSLAAGWNTLYVHAWDKNDNMDWDMVNVCFDDPYTPEDDCLA